ALSPPRCSASRSERHSGVRSPKSSSSSSASLKASVPWRHSRSVSSLSPMPRMSRPLRSVGVFETATAMPPELSGEAGGRRGADASGVLPPPPGEPDGRTLQRTRTHIDGPAQSCANEHDDQSDLLDGERTSTTINRTCAIASDGADAATRSTAAPGPSQKEQRYSKRELAKKVLSFSLVSRRRPLRVWTKAQSST